MIFPDATGRDAARALSNAGVVEKDRRRRKTLIANLALWHNFRVLECPSARVPECPRVWKPSSSDKQSISQSRNQTDMLP